MPKWLAGWNMPGYLPETEPVEFDSREDALNYLFAEAERWAEYAYDGADCNATPESDAYDDLAASIAHDNAPGATHEVGHVNTAVNVSVWVRKAES